MDADQLQLKAMNLLKRANETTDRTETTVCLLSVMCCVAAMGPGETEEGVAFVNMPAEWGWVRAVG